MANGVRKNIALVHPTERNKLLNAILGLKRQLFFPDGYSYWDKQNQIHRIAHTGGINVHSGYSFLPESIETTCRNCSAPSLHSFFHFASVESLASLSVLLDCLRIL
jgi:hypothetical protein